MTSNWRVERARAIKERWEFDRDHSPKPLPTEKGKQGKPVGQYPTGESITYRRGPEAPRRMGY